MKKKIPFLLISVVIASFAFAFAGAGHDTKHDQHSTITSPPKTHEHAAGHGSESTVGYPAPAQSATRTINVTLTDGMKMLFKDDLPEVKPGSIIQFRVSNAGKIPHEFSIVSQQEQVKHAEMMRSMPSMAHEEGNTIMVAPGTTKSLTWYFMGDDMVVFSCNVPGHYESGMFKKVGFEK